MPLASSNAFKTKQYNTLQILHTCRLVHSIESKRNDHCVFPNVLLETSCIHANSMNQNIIREFPMKKTSLGRKVSETSLAINSTRLIKSPVNFVKFLRTPCLTEHLRWRLLHIIHNRVIFWKSNHYCNIYLFLATWSSKHDLQERDCC